MGRIFRIREEDAPKMQSEWCEIVLQEDDKILDLLLTGKMAEHSMDLIFNEIKMQYLTYGYKAAKELMEYKAQFPVFQSNVESSLTENGKEIARKVEAKDAIQ